MNIYEFCEKLESLTLLDLTFFPADVGVYYNDRWRIVIVYCEEEIGAITYTTNYGRGRPEWFFRFKGSYNSFLGNFSVNFDGAVVRSLEMIESLIINGLLKHGSDYRNEEMDKILRGELSDLTGIDRVYTGDRGKSVGLTHASGTITLSIPDKENVKRQLRFYNTNTKEVIGYKKLQKYVNRINRNYDSLKKFLEEK